VVSNNYCSLVALRIAGRMLAFVESHGLGYVTGADGGYQVGSHRYLPMWVSFRRKSSLNHHMKPSIQSPDLAVEVLSPLIGENGADQNF